MMPQNRLVDTYSRSVDYLRISITDRCNLNCIYCMPEEPVPWVPHKEILRYEEILRVVRIAVGLGIQKVRITGGDPLVRKGVCGFLGRLHRIDGLREVTLTTNAVILEPLLPEIWASGIRRLNISMDTLRPERFRSITGADAFGRVWNAVQAAHRMGFFPIKLNAVVIRGINDDELADLAALSLKYPFHIRFIEHMPVGRCRLKDRTPMLVEEIRERISSLGELIAVEGFQGEGPAERFRLQGAQGEIGFIGALSHHFCHRCNRLRLTASGGLRPCLLSERQFEIKTLLRGGGSDEDIAEAIREAVRSKGRGHGLSADCGSDTVAGQMSSIGG